MLICWHCKQEFGRASERVIASALCNDCKPCMAMRPCPHLCLSRQAWGVSHGRPASRASLSTLRPLGFKAGAPWPGPRRPPLVRRHLIDVRYRVNARAVRAGRSRLREPRIVQETGGLCDGVGVSDGDGGRLWALLVLTVDAGLDGEVKRCVRLGAAAGRFWGRRRSEVAVMWLRQATLEKPTWAWFSPGPTSGAACG
jgi:hypothetical protein